MIYSAEKNEAGKKWKWVRGLEQRPRKPALCRERTNKEPQKEVECSAVFAATLSSTCTTIPDINRATKKNDGPQWMANLTWKRLLYYTDTHYVITFVCAVMILCLFFLSCEQLRKLCRPQRQHRKWLLVIKHMQHTQHLHKNDFLQSDCLMKKKMGPNTHTLTKLYARRVEWKISGIPRKIRFSSICIRLKSHTMR